MNEQGGNWITTYTKRCPNCLQNKLLTAFHKDNATKSGLTVYCKDCKKKQQREYRRGNSEKVALAQKRMIGVLKREVLTYYGNGKLACVRCGFSDIRALSIDHIHGGGTKMRRKGEVGGWAWYYKLRSQDYPEGYQTLCMNCQFIKREENNE